MRPTGFGALALCLAAADGLRGRAGVRGAHAPARARRVPHTPRAAAVALDDATAERIATLLTAVPVALPLGFFAVSKMTAERVRAERRADERDEALLAVKRKAQIDAEAASRTSALESRLGTLQSRLELSEDELRRTKERLRASEEKARAEAKRLADELRFLEGRLARAVLPEPPAAPQLLQAAAAGARADATAEAELVRRLGRGVAGLGLGKVRRLQPGLQVNDLVLVIGAPEPLAVLAVSALLDKLPGVSVRATVPSINGTENDSADVAVLRSLASRRLQIVECDLLNPASLDAVLDDVGAVVYCATSSGSFPERTTTALGKILARVVSATSGKYVEEEGVRLAAEAMARQITVTPASARAMTPKFVLLSNAGVTRAGWSREKRRALPELPADSSALAAARLKGEEALRGSGVPYAIVRPVSTSAAVRRGRVVFSSGDLASGCIAQQDAAEAITEILTTQAVRVRARGGLARAVERCARARGDPWTDARSGEPQSGEGSTETSAGAHSVAFPPLSSRAPFGCKGHVEDV